MRAWIAVGLPQLAAVFAIFSGHPTQAAELSSYPTADGKIAIKLIGEIVPGDTDQLKRLIKEANDGGKTVSGIRLNSPGGNLFEGSALADAVRYARIASVVPNGSTCASACFLVFAAGSEKFVSRSARVGVHGASDESGQETANASAATIGMARISKLLGVPDNIIGKMVITPPTEMVWLTEDDLLSMNTTLTGKPAQVDADQIPSTTVPQRQVAPQTQASSESDKVTWRELTEKAISLSAAQNGGTPQYKRACQPEMKICNNAVFFEGKDGSSMMLRLTEDVDGKIISRDICSFNTYGDVRTCVDFDTGTSIRAMKNGNGDWIGLDQ